MKNRYYFLLATSLLSCSLFSMENEKRELPESEETELPAQKKQKSNHICEECNKSYSSKNNLKLHIKRKHTSDTRKFLCDQCTYSAKIQQDLTQHKVYKHSDARNFLCDLCTYSAKTQKDLTTHKTYKHSDARNFLCDQCTYSAKTQKDLTQHKANKHNEKTLSCLDCALAFKTKGDLSCHMKTKHSEFITNAFTLSTSDISANNAQDINPPQSPEFAALAAVASQLNTNNQNKLIFIPPSFIDMLSTPQTPLNAPQMISTSTNGQPSSLSLSCTALLEEPSYDQQDANTNQINTAPINSAFSEIAALLQSIKNSPIPEQTSDQNVNIIMPAFAMEKEKSCLDENTEEQRDQEINKYQQHNQYMGEELEQEEAQGTKSAKKPSCGICLKKSQQKIFSRKEDLINHYKTLHPEAKFIECPHCEQVLVRVGPFYELKRNLKRHITSYHEQDKKFPCPYCSYTNVQQTRIVNHIKKLHANMPSFSFTTSSSNNITSQGTGFNTFLNEEISPFFAINNQEISGPEKPTTEDPNLDFSDL